MVFYSVRDAVSGGEVWAGSSLAASMLDGVGDIAQDDERADGRDYDRQKRIARTLNVNDWLGLSNNLKAAAGAHVHTGCHDCVACRAAKLSFHGAILLRMA